MYRKFFGLGELPFQDRADTQFFVPTPDREETLAAMEYEAHYGKEMALVVGEAGMGKTILIRALLARLDAADHVVVLTWPSGSERSLVREMCKGCGITLPTTYSQSRGLARLRKHLTRTVRGGKRAIVIVDQAENLTTQNLSQLSAIMDLQAEGEKKLTVILVAQPQFIATLQRPEFARIKQQLFGERTLEALSHDEVGHYIRQRMSVAGSTKPNLFDSEAVRIIHDTSGGIPRLINHICSAALLGAYGAGQGRVTGRIATEVCSKHAAAVRKAETADMAAETASHVGSPVEEGLAVAAPDSRPQEPMDWFATTEIISHREEVVTPQTPEEPVNAEHEDVFAVPAASADPTAMADKLERLFGMGETLLARLERALGRADRMGATQEAALLQATAVEKHVTLLTKDADRVSTGLSNSVQHAAKTLDELESRANAMLNSAEERTEDAESRLSSFTEAMGERDERVHGVEEACRHADRVQNGLRAFADELADKADAVQERIAVLMSGLKSKEDAQRGLSETVELAAEARTRADTARTALERVVSDAGRTQARMVDDAVSACRARLEETASKAERAQREAVEKTRQEIADLTRQASIVGEDVDAVVRGSRDKLKEQTARFDRSFKELMEAAETGIAGLVRQASVVGEDADVAVRGSHDKLEEQTARFDRSFKEIMEAAETGIADLVRQVSIVGEDADAVVRGCREKLEEQTERFDRSFKEKVATAKTGLAACGKTQEALCRGTDLLTRELNEQLSAIDARRVETECTVADVAASIEDAGVAVHDLSNRVAGIQTTVTQQGERAERARTAIEEGVVRGEELVREVQSRCGQVEEIQRSISVSLVEVGSAHERAAAAREQIVESEKAAARLTTGCEEGRRLTQQLGSVVERAGELRDDIHSGSVQAEAQLKQLWDAIRDAGTQTDEKVGDLRETLRAAVLETEGNMGRLDSHNAAARHVLRDLAEANVSARATVERAAETAQAVEQASATAGDEINRLTEDIWGLAGSVDLRAKELIKTKEETEPLITKLYAATRSANGLSEKLESSISKAREQVGEIATRSDQASDVLTRLSVVDQTLHAAGEVEASVNTTVEHARAVRAELDELLADSREKIAADRSHAESLVAELAAAALPAGELVERLTTQAAASEEKASALSAQCDQADAVSQSLSSLAGALDEARDAEASVKAVATSARDVRAELCEATASAQEQTALLTDLSLGSDDLVAKHAQLTEASEQMIEALAEKIEMTQGSNEAAEALLAEFNTQAGVLGGRIQELQAKAAKVEDVVAEATQKPAEFIKVAQAEAAQLERVCAAVKKVFSGLSKATLDARSQTQAFQQASKEAGTQLQDLRGETQRASATLHEWIEEAVRAQTRLERALTQAPSIHETHPVSRLSSISKAGAMEGSQVGTPNPRAEVAPPSIGKPVGTGDLTLLPEPNADQLEPAGASAIGSSTGSTPKTRAEEVSALIQDAKRANAR